MGIRFGHVNLIADDWRALANFYTEQFGCVFVPPERDYSGTDLSAGTGVEEAALTGAHLRLPGHGSDGPTLEIYQYAHNEDETVAGRQQARIRPYRVRRRRRHEVQGAGAHGRRRLSRRGRHAPDQRRPTRDMVLRE